MGFWVALSQEKETGDGATYSVLIPSLPIILDTLPPWGRTSEGQRETTNVALIDVPPYKKLKPGEARFLLHHKKMFPLILVIFL